MTALTAVIIAFSFFIQSLLGFGGGVVSIALLSVFMPVQKAVTLVLFFQFFMGLLIFKTYRETDWKIIRRLSVPAAIGLVLGFSLFHFVPQNLMALLLVAVIILHLAKSRLQFDFFKKLITAGGENTAGIFGGFQQALLGTGGPALVVYLKQISPSLAEFRANSIAILFFLNIPRLLGSASTGLIDEAVIISVLYTLPLFLLALWLGQKWHNKMPERPFNAGIDMLLALTAVVLLIKQF